LSAQDIDDNYAERLIDSDGDGVPDSEDIEPFNPYVGRIKVTIEHPPDGAGLN
jgi:hypothetical protein